jgi:hypothetical protein
MKQESQITNNHSSFIDNQSKRRSTPVENIRQITPFYAKQTQFQKCQMNINTFSAMRYENLDAFMGVKTNPIQTQLKPKQSQFNPIQTQFKANQTQSNPIRRVFRKGSRRRPAPRTVSA